MERDSHIRPFIVPVMIGIVLGITAKLVDVPSVTADFPIFDDIHSEKYYANVLSSLPFILFFTEWYFTAFTNGYWNVKDKLLLLIAYLCFAVSWTAVVPTYKKRLCSFIYGCLLSILLIVLIRAGIQANPYELLNV